MKKLSLKKNYNFQTILLTLLFLGLPVAEALSQPTWQWAVRGGGSNGDGSANISEDEKIMDMEVDDMGNVYIIGYIRQNANINGTPVTTFGGYDILIAKYDCNGLLIWARTAGGSNDDEGRGITLSNDGNLYITGYIHSSPINTFYMGDTTITEQTSDYFLAKYDTSGNFIWLRAASPGIPNLVSLGLAVSVDNSNVIRSIMRAPTSGNFAPGFPVTGSKDYLVKIDHLGNTISVDSMYAGLHPRQTVKFDNNQNYYFSGTWINTINLAGTSYTPQGISDLIVVKYNSNANLEWVYTQGHSGKTATARAMEVDDNGNAYITGTIADDFIFGGDTMNNTFSTVSYPFVAKIDPNGQAVWGANPSTQHVSFGIGITPDQIGNVYANILLSGDGIFGSQTITPSGQMNSVLVKYDANGNTQWAEMLNSNGGGQDRFTIMRPDAAGNIYMGGSFAGTVTINGNTNTSAGGKTDFLLVKHGMASCVVGIDELAGVNYGIHAYPNPSAGKFLIRLERFIPNQNDLVSIYNNLGQLVKEERIEFPGVASIDLTILPAGIYHVRAFDGEKYVSTKVVVKY